MMKEALVIGGAAAVGTFVTQKYGAPLEAWATQHRVPPMFAHLSIVAGSTVLAFIAARHLL